MLYTTPRCWLLASLLAWFPSCALAEVIGYWEPEDPSTVEFDFSGVPGELKTTQDIRPTTIMRTPGVAFRYRTATTSFHHASFFLDNLVPDGPVVRATVEPGTTVLTQHFRGATFSTGTPFSIRSAPDLFGMSFTLVDGWIAKATLTAIEGTNEGLLVGDVVYSPDTRTK